MEQFWMDFILRVGFPIVVIIMLIRGDLVPGFIYKRVVAENERLTTVTEEKVIPLAVEGQRLLREALEVMEERGSLGSGLSDGQDSGDSGRRTDRR